MGRESIIKGMIDEKLLDMHTAFVGRVLSYDAGTASIQPLAMSKQYGQPAQKKSVLNGVPVINSARQKFSTKEITYTTGTGGTRTETIVVLTPLSRGDVVFCVCADRDITEAKNGVMATPQIGHHSLSDSVVVGIL